MEELLMEGRIVATVAAERIVAGRFVEGVP
jgi:hypothetical protein